MMKKVITAVIAVTMTVTAYAAQFADTRGHWAEHTINVLADRGIVDGFSNTEFMPDGNVTRAQYLKMIMEATGVAVSPYRYGECLEVAAEDWYAPYLQKALDTGLIPDSMIAGCKKRVEYEVDESGKAVSSRVVYEGAFNGNLNITREEMAALTQYFYQYTRTVITNKSVSTEGQDAFKDEDSISPWAKTAIKQSVASGFIDGMDDGGFHPSDNATRAQAATVILRVLNKQEEDKKR